MINPIKTIPVGMEINILAGATIILTLIAVGIILYNKKHPDKEKMPKLPAVLGCIALIPILLLAFIQANLVGANHKGLQYVNWKSMTLEQIHKTAKITPTASKTPEDLTGSIVILYKFGCPDCEAIYPDLQKKLQGKDNVYFVPSGSDLGQKLVKKGKIQEVPTGVYIRKKAIANGATQNNIVLYAIDKKGNPILNEKALDRLFLLQKQGK